MQCKTIPDRFWVRVTFFLVFSTVVEALISCELNDCRLFCVLGGNNLLSHWTEDMLLQRGHRQETTRSTITLSYL
jgi:hypothetical protein